MISYQKSTNTNTCYLITVRPRCEADLSDIREEFIYKHLNPSGTGYCICISVIKQSRLEQSNKDTIAYSPETSMYDMIDYREEFSLIN